jgi:hypothetical protein
MIKNTKLLKYTCANSILGTIYKVKKMLYVEMVQLQSHKSNWTTLGFSINLAQEVLTKSNWLGLTFTKSNAVTSTLYLGSVNIHLNFFFHIYHPIWINFRTEDVPNIWVIARVIKIRAVSDILRYQLIPTIYSVPFMMLHVSLYFPILIKFSTRDLRICDWMA